MRVYPARDEDIVPGEWLHRHLEPCGCGCETFAAELGQHGGQASPFMCVECRRTGAFPADSKPSNPKDIAAQDRAVFNIPVVALIEEGLALFEGALKYGWNNYSIVGVRSTVYVFASLRHTLKWYCGQTRDPVSAVHHLGNARACLGILMDAEQRGKLEDDRPPAVSDLDALFTHATTVMQGLIALYADRKPRNYTIADTES